MLEQCSGGRVYWLASRMLLSTKIFIGKGSKTSVVRDWRVVNIQDKDCRHTSFVQLYMQACVRAILSRCSPWSQLSDSSVDWECQNINNFLDIPLNVCMADAINAFGMYIKYIVLVDSENVSECMQGVTGEKRDAFEVLTSVHMINTKVLEL